MTVPLCKTCRWLGWEEDGYAEDGYYLRPDKCERPIVDYVRGGKDVLYRDPKKERNDPLGCGAVGRYWEAGKGRGRP